VAVGKTKQRQRVKIFQQFCGAVAAWLLCRLGNLHAKRSRNKTEKQKKNHKTIKYKL